MPSERWQPSSSPAPARVASPLPKAASPLPRTLSPLAPKAASPAPAAAASLAASSAPAAVPSKLGMRGDVGKLRQGGLVAEVAARFDTPGISRHFDFAFSLCEAVRLCMLVMRLAVSLFVWGQVDAVALHFWSQRHSFVEHTSKLC